MTVGLRKQMSLCKISQYFPKPYKSSGRNIKFELDLSNYAAKVDRKKAAAVDASNLAAKSGLASLKAWVDKIVIDKRKTVLANLSTLSEVVDNDFTTIFMILFYCYCMINWSQWWTLSMPLVSVN